MTENDLQRALGRVEGKLDAILENMDRGEQRMNDHSRRLRTLEGWQKFVLGISAAISAAVAFAMHLWRG